MGRSHIPLVPHKRPYTSIEALSRSEIAFCYLEVFVALLKEMEESSMVHNLREVMTIWLVTTTCLTPLSTTASTSLFSNLSIQKFTRPVALHTLLILEAAARYKLMQLPVIDAQFLATLLEQAHRHLTDQKTPGALVQEQEQKEKQKQNEQTSAAEEDLEGSIEGRKGATLDECCAATIEAGAHIYCSIIIVERAAPVEYMARTREWLDAIRHLNSDLCRKTRISLGPSELFHAALGLPMEVDESVEAAEANAVTIQRVLEALPDLSTNPLPPRDPLHCSTIEELRILRAWECATAE